MNEFFIFVYIVVAVFSVILYFKTWRMCDDIHAMKLRQEEKLGAISKRELMFLHRTKHPSFNETLLRAIYHDLIKQLDKDTRKQAEEWYKFTYESWEKVCETNRWEFPAPLAGLNRLDKFETEFLPK
mgnify:CR=1 FL=1